MGRWPKLRRLPWRWTLSALQVLLAATLLIAGHIEKGKHQAQLKPQSTDEGWQVIGEYDYMPLSYGLLIIVDFPVVLAFAPVAVVIKSHLAVRVLFLILVAFFWYWIGRGLERRWNEPEIPRKLPTKFGLAANVTGFIVSGILLVLILWSGSGPTSLLVYMAILAWCAGFATYFAVKVARVWHFKQL